MALDLELIPGSLPAGFCFTTWQALYNQFFNLGIAQFPDNVNTFNYGDTTPAAVDQGKPWLRTIAGVPDRWYIFSLGFWLWPHEAPASGSERRLWVGTETALETYDGGEAGAITSTSGAFWAVDHALDARMPLGPGTLPSGAVVAVTVTGGAEKITLTQAQLPADTHKHLSPWMASLAASDATTFPYGSGPAIAGSGRVVDDSANNHSDRVLPYTEPVALGSGQSHDNMPPYYGIFLIKRTARIYRRV